MEQLEQMITLDMICGFFTAAVAYFLTKALMWSRVKTAERIAAHAVASLNEVNKELSRIRRMLDDERNRNVETTAFANIVRKAAVRDEPHKRWLVRADDSIDRYIESGRFF